jgi:hypothetical protein
VFFDKEGGYLNFKWDDTSTRWSGDIFLSKNSTDTHRTQALYLFERIPSFEYELPGDLYLNKFQLFNEFAIDINGSNIKNTQINKYENVNKDPNFYSKWIYGDNFEKLYPIGSFIKFDSILFDISNLNEIYPVIATKKGAIMILTTTNNQSFDNTYSSQVNQTSSYTNKTISGVNSVGFYNYVDSLYNDNYSNWSEPIFYTKLYDGKKLTLLNTENNDGVYTITNTSLSDKVYYKYSGGTLPSNSDLYIRLKLKTDIPLVYSGNLNLYGNTIEFSSPVPSELRPGIQFQIPGSILNGNFLTVDTLLNFNTIVNTTYFPNNSQVLWNNIIYQCVQGYTHSATSSITPDDPTYWSNPTYINVQETLNSEYIVNGDIYLTTNQIDYYQPWIKDSNITLASAAEQYADEFKRFGIYLYFQGSSLKAELAYPGDYATVDFYHTLISPTYSVGSFHNVYERIVEVEENMIAEVNENKCSNFEYRIVFTDLDEYGAKLTINGEVYHAEINWVYNGPNVDMERTIDKTIRNWLVKYIARLTSLGVLPSLVYTGNLSSIYYNTIVLKTEYPNVPLDFDVKVGTTADFYIEHSDVIFYDVAGQFGFNINGKRYEEPVIYSSPNVVDINQTVSNWVSTHSNLLSQYGIYVVGINDTVKFRVKDILDRLEYTVFVGKSNLPAELFYSIIKRIKGNFGMTITSNEVMLNSVVTGTDSNDFMGSLMDAGFATGMVFSINSTLYPYNNQEYNILTLDPGRLNLSYQGPFWGTTGSNICDNSAFTTIAFSIGFGATACEPATAGPGASGSGEFAVDQFGSMFNLYYAPENSYELFEYDGTANMVDILHSSANNMIYALGNSILVYDSILGTQVSTIIIPGNTQSVSLEYNPFNNYLYVLTKTALYKINTTTNTINATILFSGDPHSMLINPLNGDIYITYNDMNKVDIYSTLNSLITSVSTLSTSNHMVYNSNENNIYVSLGNDTIISIGGYTRVINNTYGGFVGLNGELYYDSNDYVVYGFDDSLFKIDSGVITQIGLSASTFNSLLVNNLTGTLQGSQNLSNSYFNLNNSYSKTFDINAGEYGKLVLNQYDGDVYMSSEITGKVLVFSATTGVSKYNISFSGKMSKHIYNPDRKSIWGIIPTQSKVKEIGVQLNSQLVLTIPEYQAPEGDNYGSLDPNSSYKRNLWLKTREYFRKPRENYSRDGKQVDYIVKWENDNVPEMFVYDFSGDFLEKTGPYAYTGVKPLSKIVLNKNPNRDIYLTDVSEAQQTIFDELSFKLPYLDDSTNASILPEPLELFIGFKSDVEGVVNNNLQIIKREYVSLSFSSNSTNYISLTQYYDDNSVLIGKIEFNTNSLSYFTGVGFQPNQLIKILLSDNTNKKGQYKSNNSGKIFKIREVYTRTLIVDFITNDFGDTDFIEDEVSYVVDFPLESNTTYLDVKVEVIDKVIAHVGFYGETESEDIRYKTHITNFGLNVNPEDAFIFSEYDINEGGVDWSFMNKKRKEMLLVRNEIFPYVGSYKSIINAINFFGYNDLELYEYYRNVDSASNDFMKLFKVEVPDIFDNQVEGWKDNDFIKHTFPNPKYENTNLFNLSYKITDKEGNKVITYSLTEVIIKLQGLKWWLSDNIIPLTHKILDITGRTDFVGDFFLEHRNYEVVGTKISQELTPVDFKINEAYLLPISSGSTVYNVVVDFFTQDGSVPSWYDVNIRTYETKREWESFKTYNVGDEVIYYDKLYRSHIASNKLNNPREFENSTNWNLDGSYVYGQVVNYDNVFYMFSSTQSGTQSLTPKQDTINWTDVTKWEITNMKPVQTINQIKTDLTKFNFTLDSNIDPYIVIEVTTDNGYGLIYRSIKKYEIRFTKDLVDSTTVSDPIGPFTPVIPIYISV